MFYCWEDITPVCTTHTSYQYNTFLSVELMLGCGYGIWVNWSISIAHESSITLCVFVECFSFKKSYEYFETLIFYTPWLAWKLKYHEQLNIPNIFDGFVFKIDFWLIYSNVKVGCITLVLLNENSRYCTLVRREQHLRVWRILKTTSMYIGSKMMKAKLA